LFFLKKKKHPIKIKKQTINTKFRVKISMTPYFFYGYP